MPSRNKDQGRYGLQGNRAKHSRRQQRMRRKFRCVTLRFVECTDMSVGNATKHWLESMT